MNLFKYIFFCFLFFIYSCSNFDSENTFILLPSVNKKDFKIGKSVINPRTVKYAFSNLGSNLPLLFGISKQIEITDNSKMAQIDFNIISKPNQKKESYTLKIEKGKIKIQAQDKQGLFYAFITLNQVLEDAIEKNISLPLVDIFDAPKISYRPIHIDVKHHLEKKSYYYTLIDELAQLKINGIIIEIEDKLKYKRRPKVGSNDALSIEEWKVISDYALARNIKISPLVQGLGHASFVLKHDIYKDLRDDLNSDWAFNPLDPEVYKLQFDLYLDALEAFPHGDYLHVGGDEVQTTGRKSGKNALELNLIWLNKVTSFANDNKRIPIFWDDMPLKQAGLMNPIYDSKMSKEAVDSIWQKNEPILNRFLKKFPKNCVYMRWNYHMAETYGNGKAMDWFSSNGFEVMGATAGQTRWTLMPQRESNIDQIRIFAEQSINRNYRGLLLTLWDDDSPHFELYKRGIHAFAEFTWGGMKRSKDEFKKAYRHRKFGSNFQSDRYSFIDKLDKPVELWTNLFLKNNSHRNSLNRGENSIEEKIIDLPDFEKKGIWTEKYSDRLDQLEIQRFQLEDVKNVLKKIQHKNPKSNYNLKVYNQVLSLVNYNFKLMSKIKNFDLAKTKEQEIQILKELDVLVSEFKNIREEFENVYSQTRELNKPENYILDQDHHNHQANQSINFDCQFAAELMLIKKIKQHFKIQPYLLEGTKPGIL